MDPDQVLPHLDPSHLGIGILQLHDAVEDHCGVNLGLYVFQGLQNPDVLRDCDNKMAVSGAPEARPVCVPNAGGAPRGSGEK